MMEAPAVRKLAFGITALAGVSCAACSASGLNPVSGTVTYLGSPAAGAVVSFQRRGDAANDGQPMVGIVQQDGTFALLCGALGQGAPPGEYDVLIEWRRGLGGGCCAAGTKRSQAQVGADKLKGRYADRKRPLLHATVEARATHLPPFELADGGAARCDDRRASR